MGVLEDIYSTVGNWAKYWNQKRVIDAQVPYQREYEKIIEAMRNATSSQEKQQLNIQLKNIEKFYDYNNLRQNQADKYDAVVAKRDSLTNEQKLANKLLSAYLSTKDQRKKALIREEFQDTFQESIQHFYKKNAGLTLGSNITAIPKLIGTIIDGRVLKNEKLKQASQIRKGETLFSDSNSYVINNSKQKESAINLVDKYAELYKQTSAYKDDVEKNKLEEIERLSKAKKIEQRYGIENVNYNTIDSSASFDWIKNFYKSRDAGDTFKEFSSIIKNQYSASDSALVLTPEKLIKNKEELNRTFSTLKTNINLLSSVFDSIGNDVNDIEGGLKLLKFINNIRI